MAGQAARLKQAQAVRLAWNGVKLLSDQAVSTFDNNLYVVDAIRSRIADLPLDAATNFFTGWADSLTGGLHGRLREAMGIDTFVDRDSGTYMAGNMLGVVHGFLLGSGAGNTAHIGWAYTSARGITAVSTTGGVIEASINFASGEGTVMDALDLMPAGGAVLGKLTDGLGIFRCFVGDTPVVVAVEEVTFPVTVEEPASIRFIPLATGGTCIALATALQFHQHRRRRNRNGTSNRLVPRRRRRTPAAPREGPSCRTHTPAPEMTTSAAVRSSLRQRTPGRHLDELTMLPEPAQIQQTLLQLFPLRQLWNRSASAQGVTGNHSSESPSEHQPPIKQSADPPTDNWPRSLMTPISLLLLAIGSLLTWTGLGHDPISPVEPDTATAGMASGSATAINFSPAVCPLTLPIRDVRLGQRVVGRNPLRDDVDHTTPEPDRDSWREIHLSLTKPDGRTVSIELLRPVEWLVLQVLAAEPPPTTSDSVTPLTPLALPLAGRTDDGTHDTTDAFAVFIGRKIRLDLPEMGAAGPAVITSIRPCPPIEPDDETGRRVVTGRFIHAPDGGLLALLVEGENTPTGVTDNHPYWSVTRQRFVAAGQLEVGEQIDTLTGPRRIHQIAPRIQRETVYNLEVHSEHVYRVGSLGTLVHNVYPYSGPLERGMHLTNKVGAGSARPPSHHVFPQEFRDWFLQRHVKIDRVTVPMDQGTHTAIHTMGWNDAMMTVLRQAEAVKKGKLSAREIWEAGYRQMRLFGIADLPIVPYD